MVYTEVAVHESVERGSAYVENMRAHSVFDVVDVRHLPECQRVRGRLARGGWASLLNTEKGHRWAQPELGGAGASVAPQTSCPASVSTSRGAELREALGRADRQVATSQDQPPPAASHRGSVAAASVEAIGAAAPPAMRACPLVTAPADAAAPVAVAPRVEVVSLCASRSPLSPAREIAVAEQATRPAGEESREVGAARYDKVVDTRHARSVESLKGVQIDQRT